MLTALQPALAILEGQSLDSLQVLGAPFMAAQHYPRLDPSQPVLLLGCSPGPLLSRIQRTLMLAYPPEHPLTIILPGRDSHQPIPKGTGSSTGGLRLLALNDLAELDHSGHAPTESGDDSPPSGPTFSSPGVPNSFGILIPPLPAASTYEALQDVAAHLRAPEGCPWDQALTWAKLRSSLLEETYELLAALDADDAGKVAEELGDLLLQVAMQTQIAAEEGRFRLPDVIARVVGKLIRRHPHVFGDAVVSGTDEVLANWEAIKAAERAQNGEQRSPLAGVPAGLPALAQADAYLDRMSRLRSTVGRSPQKERVEHLDVQTLFSAAESSMDAEVTPETVGEILFGLVAWARARGVDAESALRMANERYAAEVAAQV